MKGDVKSMKYWFWRYLHDYREDKKSLLKLSQKLDEAILHRKRIEEELSDILYNLNDVDENNSARINCLLYLLEFTDPNNPLSDIAINEDHLKDSARELLLYYDATTLDCYALLYENLDER